MSIDTAFERLRQANPIPGSEPYGDRSLDLEALLAERQRRRMMQTEEHTKLDERRPRALVYAAAALGLVVLVGLIVVLSGGNGDVVDEVPLTTVAPQPTTPPSTAPVAPAEVGFPADLTGIYSGQVIYEEEDGTTHDRVLFALDLVDADGDLSGDLSRAEPGSDSFNLGRDLIPLNISRDGDTVTAIWNDAVGHRQDSTPSQCVLDELALTLQPMADPQRLEIVDGVWSSTGGQPRPTDEACHNHGFPLALRGRLIQRETFPTITPHTPARLAVVGYRLAGEWSNGADSSLTFTADELLTGTYVLSDGNGAVVDSGSFSIDYDLLSLQSTGNGSCPSGSVTVVDVTITSEETMEVNDVVTDPCGFVDLLAGVHQRSG